VEAAHIITSSPPRLSFGRTGHDYDLASDLIALHGTREGPSAVLALEGDGVFVYRLDNLRQSVERDRAGPVYRRRPDGEIVIPTGRVLVRFAQGVRAEEHREDLARAGYVLETTLRYAPQAIWVRARDGDIAGGLRNLQRLRELPGVEQLEAQMLSESKQRH
jgi:hypothetical protein